MRTAVVVLVLAFAALAFAPSIARADAITDEEADCRGKPIGAACGTNGACVASKCGHGGSGWDRSTYDCGMCVEGAPRKATPDAGGGGGGGGKGLYIGIAVAVSLIVCGLAFAYTRRRKPGA